MPALKSIPYFSADRTACKPALRAVKQFPLPKDCPIRSAAFSLTQDFEILGTSFPPAPFNTPATAATFNAKNGSELKNSNAILTDYSPPQNSTAAMIKFQGTFNIVPASWDDFKPLTFAFPGFPGIIGQTNSRDPFSLTVTARMRYDYFVVDPNNLAAGVADSAGQPITSVASLGAIPQITKSIFCVALNGVPDFTNITNSIVPAGGKNINGTLYYQTLPQLANYQAWITTAKDYLKQPPVTAWDQTHPAAWDGVTDSDKQAGASIGQIVAQDSWIENYAGNIVARITPYILVR